MLDLLFATISKISFSLNQFRNIYEYRMHPLQYFVKLSPSYGNDLPLQAHLTRDVC